MGSVNDKQLCNIYESNSLRRPCHVLIGKLLAFDYGNYQPFQPLSYQVLKYNFLVFHTKVQYLSAEMPELVVSLLDPLVTSPSTYKPFYLEDENVPKIMLIVLFAESILSNRSRLVRKTAITYPLTHFLLFVNTWQWTCRQPIMFCPSGDHCSLKRFEPVKPANTRQ